MPWLLARPKVHFETVVRGFEMSYSVMLLATGSHSNLVERS